MTLEAYRTCRCSGVVRVDFIVTPEGRPYFIELNSIPGMSAGSIVPKPVSYTHLVVAVFMPRRVVGAI